MSTFVKCIVGTLATITLFFGGVSLAHAQAEGSSATELERFNVHCGFSIDPSSKKELMDCVPAGIYYLIYKPTGYLLTGSAYIFDALFPLSLSRTFINQPFIEGTAESPGAWTIVRDFANMAFIFILLYIGISTILGLTGDWRGPVLQVVIIALFMNFSLFFTKVVIDAGNILAVGIYNQMGSKSATAHTNEAVTGIPERGLSFALATHFQPQKFMGAATDTKDANPFNAIFVFIVAAIVSTYVAYVFLNVAFLMVSRLLMFWYYMISSPIAFLSWATPKWDGFWGRWLHGLTSQTFFPVVFLFFLYLIISVLNSGIMENMVPTEGVKGMVDTVIIIVLKTMLIIMAVKKSLDAANSMADQAGGIVQSWGMKGMRMVAGGVAGGVGKVALGYAAKTLRSKVGGAAQNAYERGTFRSMALKDIPQDATRAQKIFGNIGRMVGRAGVAATDTARQGSLDIRGIGLVQKAAKAAGIDVGTSKAGQGGYAKMVENQEGETIKSAEKYKLTDAEKDAIAVKTTGKSLKELAKDAEDANTLLAVIVAQGKEAKSLREKAEKAEQASPTKKALADAEAAYQDVLARKAAGDPKATDMAVEFAQRDLEKKTQEHASSGASIAFKDASASLERIIKQQKEADKIKEDTAQKKKDAGIAVDREGERRAGVVAEHIESGVTQTIRTVLAPLTYSHRAADRAAQKIRYQASAEGRAEKKKKKKSDEILTHIADALSKEEKDKPAQEKEGEEKEEAH